MSASIENSVHAAETEGNQRHTALFLHTSNLSNLEVDRTSPGEFQRVAEFEVVGGTKGGPPLRE